MTPPATETSPPPERTVGRKKVPAAETVRSVLRTTSSAPLPGWQLALGIAFGVMIASLTGKPLQAALLAIAVPFTLVTSLRTKVIAYLVVLPLVGWLKYQYPQTAVQGVPDLIELTMLFQVGFEWISGRVRLPIRHPLVLLVFGYIAFVLVQSQAPIARASGFGFSGARVFLEPMVLFIVGLVFWRDPTAPRLFFRISVFVGLIVGLYMLKQLVFGLSPAEVAFLTGRANFVAATEGYLFSTLSSTGTYGFVTFMFTMACLGAVGTRSTSRRLAVLVAAISAFGIFTSGARISLLGALPAGAAMIGLIGTSPGGRRFARRLAGLGLAMIILLVALVAITPVRDRRELANARNPVDSAITKLAMLKAGSSDDDLASRFDRFGKFLNYIEHHPWGAGTGVINLVNNTTPPQAGVLRTAPPLPELLRDKPWIFQHDFYYFSVGIELGLLPLILFLLILIIGIALAIGARKGEFHRGRRMVLNVTAATTMFVLIHNLTNESFRTPQVAGYVWLLLSAPVAFRYLRQTDAAEATVVAAAVPPSRVRRAKKQS